jgi:hypothetical protein
MLVSGAIRQSLINSVQEPYLQTFLTFDLIPQRNLRDTRYSNEQKHLYNTISDMRSRGNNDREISDYLNTQGFKTLSGKRFDSSSAYDIVRKRNMRLNILNKEAPAVLRNFGIFILQ